MIHRICNLSDSHSFFLFGPRGVGKTTYLEQWSLSRSTWYVDLLDPQSIARYFSKPDLLIKDWESIKSDWIIIDEIQKLPELLDVIQKQMKKKDVLFALTGSSARKLRRGASNLLGGRAFEFHLHPLTHIELGVQFNLLKALKWGTLPYLNELTDANKVRSLYSYVSTYLKEEVLIEQIVRKIEPFKRFLEVAAQMNGQILNYAKIARDTGVEERSVARYFQILDDTLLGFHLYPYNRSIRKQQSQKAKFYFFDPGVTRTLQNKITLELTPKSSDYGDLFEHFIILEMIRLNDYYEKHYEFTYLRTKDDLEVDIIIQRPGQSEVLIEIKSKDYFDRDDSRSLRLISSEFKNAEFYVLSNCTQASVDENIQYEFWEKGLKKIFGISQSAKS